MNKNEEAIAIAKYWQTFLKLHAQAEVITSDGSGFENRPPTNKPQRLDPEIEEWLSCLIK